MEIIKATYINFKHYWAASFRETVSVLAECNLKHDMIASVLYEREQKGIKTLLAIDSGKVIGTVSYFIEQKFIHNGGTVSHLEDLAVHPDQGGKGVGGALVKEVLRLSQEAGCYKVILDCNDELEGYYNKLGFYRKGFCMRYDCR